MKASHAKPVGLLDQWAVHQSGIDFNKLILFHWFCFLFLGPGYIHPNYFIWGICSAKYSSNHASFPSYFGILAGTTAFHMD